jgi:hypothetical protein
MGLMLLKLTTWGQSDLDEINKSVRHFVTPQLNYNKNDSNIIFVKMGFNDAISENYQMKIDIDRVESVILSYTRYKLSESFSQEELNKKRMQRLIQLIPELKNNKNIKWFWFEQTGCDDPTSCKDYYHGFVITLNSPEAMEYKLTELALLDYYASVYEGKTDHKYMDSMIALGKIKMTKKCDTVIIRNAIKGNRVPKARAWDRNDTEKLLKFFNYNLGSNDTLHFVYETNEKGEFTELKEAYSYEKSKKIIKFLKRNTSCIPGRQYNKKLPSRVYASVYKSKFGYKTDLKALPLIGGEDTFDIINFLYNTQSTIVCDYLDTSMLKVGKGFLSHTQNIIPKVFERNTQWKNCLIVTDVTGSMFPYLAQFQMWHKLHINEEKNHDFVFFNDGDNLPDMLKTVGKVGGLYYVKTHEYENLIVTMKTAMLKGSGGDRPENNLEAVLEGLKQNPSIKEVIMIADNQATPRDMELLSKIKVPIHLILCGTQNGINPDYLTLIRSNKGTLHTIEEDLMDLSKVKEGQIIKIDGNSYKLKSGVFTKI